mmetsp:Transcript_24451/g.53151  ORF Transcript_24451/g.53151 Transcript_24451/m.53151 type:complete len:469 (-) Transcript_24451:357-1763(-)|eukprot:CAMPEP_0206465324 /NCGR_PEP_ID=MMETSP0324_2-20121206/27758_1 /ASSEMBLY_ACC=CAM_ASM_000836 /TAXON_ID=2866 /ORGANISM="Crypthecodinium cohnii, Strain Seligo" /LENGTH=468 /DNA_ID=CAMNT_0053938153 /DNA_START=223 /DNA_END=1629 /DNA_ORIENTATION=-
MCNGNPGSDNQILPAKALRDRTHVLSSKRDIQEEFSFGKKLIGRGGFGEVNVAVRRASNGVRAVKSVLQKGASAHSRILGGEMHEAMIMASVDHPNVVRLIMTFEDRTHLHMVMELCGGGDLAGHLTEARFFSGESATSIMTQVLRAICYLHKCEICHRDVKLENFLVQKPGPLPDNVLKIADFGLACRASSDDWFTQKLGTVKYWSPEMAKGRYNRLCDVWGGGVIFYTLLCGAMPFQGKTDDEVLIKVKKGNYAFLGPAWERVKDIHRGLVRLMLKYEPHDRLCAESLLQELRLAENQANPKELSAKAKKPLLDAGTCSLLAAGLWNLHNSSAFRRAALRALVWQTDEADLTDFGDLFSALDADGDGQLSAQELRNVGIWELRDVDANGELDKLCPMDYTDFQVVMHGEGLCLRRSAFRAAFSALDRDGDGVISKSDLDGVPGMAGKDVSNMKWDDFEQEVLTLHL